MAYLMLCVDIGVAQHSLLMQETLEHSMAGPAIAKNPGFQLDSWVLCAADPDWFVVNRANALLKAVPKDLQHPATDFTCNSYIACRAVLDASPAFHFDSLTLCAADPDWSLVERTNALLKAIPADVQHAADDFTCNNVDEGRGLMGWMTDAALRLGSKPITVQTAPAGRQHS